MAEVEGECCVDQAQEHEHLQTERDVQKQHRGDDGIQHAMHQENGEFEDHGLVSLERDVGVQVAIFVSHGVRVQGRVIFPEKPCADEREAKEENEHDDRRNQVDL